MPETILLVEDETAIADTLVYALESEGFTVVWRRLAGEGLNYLASAHADLVILDVGLPDENGFDVCRRLRQQWSMPVIFLTARKEEVDRIVGLEIGADDYVTKPFSPREVAARVRAVLRRTLHQAVSPAESGKPHTAFALDDDGKRIAFRGRWLDLTRYEYQVLRVLAERPGRVFSRAQLMDQAWEDPAQSFDRAVDTHIKTLRAKLRQIDPDCNPIRTHRGLGYSVASEPSA
ncbi:two-component system response regulator CreB [Isoalcanivorax indicus]|uniref:two-component system response regulator CreB n=1 Tax=Isoalcanivorax indicus TaxID=2202653 RepID=UPI000DB974E7|nr:two-component system response regulator CreB [Isoalcanivorax indicus]